jgi:hypothetical protein
MASCADHPAGPEAQGVPLLERIPEIDARTTSFLVTGPWSNASPHVKVFSGSGSSLLDSFFAYNASFMGGVRVAVGDVNRDGRSDIITGAGPGGGHVKVFDRATGDELKSFFPYGASFAGGVFVAAGDIEGDGYADIITGAVSSAGPHVKVYSGATGAQLNSFLAYGSGVTGGVSVAAGDVNGDGYADIVTGAGSGAGPHVKVYSGAPGPLLHSFFAYAADFTGGVHVATADVNGDGYADIVTGAGPGGGPHVKVFSGATGAELKSFLAYAPDFSGGVSVASVDNDGDGQADIVTGAGPGGGPHVKVFSGSTGAELASFFAYPVDFLGGVFVAVGTATASGETPTVDDILSEAHEAIADATLVGDGPSTNARRRMAAWLNMLADAGELIESGDLVEACGQLQAAYLRADGSFPPPDFVSGPARESLAEMIQALLTESGCSTT